MPSKSHKEQMLKHLDFRYQLLKSQFDGTQNLQATVAFLWRSIGGPLISVLNRLNRAQGLFFYGNTMIYKKN